MACGVRIECLHVSLVFEMVLYILQVGLVPEKVLGVRPHVGPVFEMVRLAIHT